MSSFQFFLFFFGPAIGIQHLELQRPFCVQMDIPLRECNDDACFTEQIINAESNIAFNYATFHQTVNADPKIDIKYERIIPEIIEKCERFGLIEDLYVHANPTP